MAAQRWMSDLPIKLCGDSPAAFFEAFWQVRPFSARNVCDGPSLFSSSDLGEVLELGDWRYPNLRAYKNGEPLPNNLYSTTRNYAGREIYGSISVPDLMKETSEGGSIVLQNLEKYMPSLANFCRLVENWFGFATHLTAFATFPGGIGLAEHADRVDVFVLQTEGSREWTVSGEQPLTLAAGDSMYIPAGAVHRPEPVSELSIHISICLSAVSWADALIEFMQDPLGIAPFSGPYARSPWPIDSVGNRAAELADCLALVASAIDPDAISNFLMRRFLVQSLRFPRSTLDVQPADAGTIWNRRSIHVLDTWNSDEGCLEINGKRLIVPGRARQAVQRMLSGDRFQSSSLPGLLTVEAKIQLAKDLEREGILERIEEPFTLGDPDLSDG